MTGSAKCSFCDKITKQFIYNVPRADPNNINDGNWVCDDHFYGEKNSAEQLAHPNKNQLNGNISRRERRALKRKSNKTKSKDSE